MLVVKYSGGLGNQMYQYALQRVLQEIYKDEKIKADLSFYNILYEHNGFELLDAFQIDNFVVASKKEIKNFCYKYVPGGFAKHLPNWLKRKLAFSIQYKISKINSIIHKKQRNSLIYGLEINAYNDLIKHLNIEKSFYFEGLWQNINYFIDYENKLPKWFVFKKKYRIRELEILKNIEKKESVSVHMRRGDFVNTSLDICNIEYYKKAFEKIEKLVDSPTYFIFTDDYYYAKDFFEKRKNVYIIKSTVQDGIYDMMLMSSCKHNIISNSTFSFWASMLNRNDSKIVVAPMYCIKNDIGNYTYSLPENYIRIET